MAGTVLRGRDIWASFLRAGAFRTRQENRVSISLMPSTDLQDGGAGSKSWKSFHRGTVLINVTVRLLYSKSWRQMQTPSEHPHTKTLFCTLCSHSPAPTLSGHWAYWILSKYLVKVCIEIRMYNCIQLVRVLCVFCRDAWGGALGSYTQICT